MFQNEENWRKGRRNNRIAIGVGLIAVVLAPLASRRFGIDSSMLNGAAWGVFGGSIAFEFWIFRKPPEPTPEVIDKLERGNIPVTLVSTLATWGFLGCLMIGLSLGIDHPLYWLFMGTGAGLLLVALILLPRLVAHMRYSQVVPALHDERSQINLDKAYRKGFLLMFQVSFLGVLLLMMDVVDPPAHMVGIGIGLIGMCSVSLLWCWYDWKDSR